MGSRHCVTGRLMQARRGLVLEIEDGGVYALDLDRPVEDLLGQRVTVEGARSGFDRLGVEWIGSAPPRDAPERRQAMIPARAQLLRSSG